MNSTISNSAALAITSEVSEALGFSSAGEVNCDNHYSRLHRTLSDVGFPVRSQSGHLQGRLSYQIIFDRHLGKSSNDRSSTSVVNWLFCEWNDVKRDDGESMILAIGTLSDDLKIEVAIAGFASVVDSSQIIFSEAFRVGRKDNSYMKGNDLGEKELVSFITPFRSSLRNGATIFAEELR